MLAFLRIARRLQAGLLLEQTPQLFQTVRQLIEGTVSLFLLPEED